jgi:hypothetical protein
MLVVGWRWWSKALHSVCAAVRVVLVLVLVVRLSIRSVCALLVVVPLLTIRILIASATNHPAVVRERREAIVDAVFGVPISADKVKEEEGEEGSDDGVAYGHTGLGMSVMVSQRGDVSSYRTPPPTSVPVAIYVGTVVGIIVKPVLAFVQYAGHGERLVC